MLVWFCSPSPPPQMCGTEIGCLLGLLGPSIPACQLPLSGVWGVQFFAIFSSIGEAALACIRLAQKLVRVFP